MSTTEEQVEQSQVEQQQVEQQPVINDAMNNNDDVNELEQRSEVTLEKLEQQVEVVHPSQVEESDVQLDEMKEEDELLTNRDSVSQPLSGSLSLAHLIPMVQQQPSTTSGASSSRLAFFFCGLVYGEVRNAEFYDATLYHLIKYAMETVETHASLSGSEKKQLVLNVVRMVVVRKPMDEEVRARCLDLLDSGAVSEIIDLTIAASKGLVALNARAKRSACTQCVIN